MSYILSIDQGTTGSTVSIVNSQGEIIASASEDFEQIYPKPGWVEHNPRVIWKTIESCTRAVLQKSHIQPKEISGIGITNQRETVVVWDRKTHEPVYNAIVWQCRRTTEFCKKLSKYKKTIQSKTGLVIDPYFSASKIRWILDNDKNLKKRISDLAAGTIDSFLIWKLTGGETHATDVSNASRTQLMNIKTGKWDEALLKIFGVPKGLLPQIMPSSGVIGHTKKLSFLPDGIPVSGVAGDQQAALFGQTCFEVGEAKCTYGTGSFLLMNTGAKLIHSKSGLLTTVAWQLEGQKSLTYALEGSVFICGASVQWLRDNLGFFEKSEDIEKLASEVSDSGGVEFVPALTGLGAPYWNPEARGLICGLTRGTKKSHIARATLEAIALQNAEVLTAMQKDLGKKLKKLKVDGGASQNNLLMQIQSDYLDTTIERPSNIETTSLGAAYLAGLGVGLWRDVSEIKKIWKVDRKFESDMNKKSRKQRFAKWKKAIQRTIL
jgi:glycerol kinase